MRIFCHKNLMIFFVFISFFITIPQARAHHCKINVPNVDFGAVDPLRITGTTAQAAIELNCYAISSPTHYCIILQGNVPERILKFLQNEIPFNFYHENAVFGGDGFGKPILGTIAPIKGRPTQFPTIPISAMLGRPEGLNLPNGSYKGTFRTTVYGAYGRDTLTAAEQDTMCKGQRPGGLSYWTDTSQNFTVAAQIKKSCSVVVSAINFGAVASLKQVKEGRGEIQIKCFGPTNYEIGLGGGNNPQADGDRAMQCADSAQCGTALVHYGLYQKSGGNQIWNNKWQSEGTVNGKSNNTLERHTVFALIEPNQNARAGRYVDSVVVEVRWN